jgi:hypothetical protein
MSVRVPQKDSDEDLANPSKALIYGGIPKGVALLAGYQRAAPFLGALGKAPKRTMRIFGGYESYINRFRLKCREWR